jgi:hypothetical protein
MMTRPDPIGPINRKKGDCGRRRKAKIATGEGKIDCNSEKTGMIQLEDDVQNLQPH